MVLQRSVEAEPLLREALDTFNGDLGQGQSKGFAILASCLAIRADWKGAEASYRRAIQAADSAEESPTLRISYTRDLAKCLMKQNRHAAAEPMLRLVFEHNKRVHVSFEDGRDRVRDKTSTYTLCTLCTLRAGDGPCRHH